jgi:hypothetical protein
VEVTFITVNILVNFSGNFPFQESPGMAEVMQEKEGRMEKMPLSLNIP